MDGPRYETQFDRPKHRCPGCGGFRWSARGECLNTTCMSEETRKRIFDPRPKKKKGSGR